MMADCSAGVQGNLSRYEVGVHGEPVCSQGHDCTDTPGVSFSSDTSVSLFEAFVKAGDVKATFRCVLRPPSSRARPRGKIKD